MSDRGNAEYYEMKGFLTDLSIKQDGHMEETMPPDPGTDVTEGAEVDNTDANAPKAANIKASDNKPASTSTTMAKDLQDIPDKAEGDIADGYIADVQHLPGPGDREKKGFEQYNEMVSKGIAVDTCGLSKYNINDAVDMIVDTANKEFDGEMSDSFGNWMSNDMSVKSFDGSMIVKMEGNAAPEDEEANEGLTEDSEGVGKTKEETDEDKGKQGENTSKAQTGGSNESFSEGGPEEEKGVGKYAGRAMDYLRGFRKMGRSGAKMQTGKDYVKMAAKNKKKLAAAGAAGAGATYLATRRKKKTIDDIPISKSLNDGSNIIEKGVGKKITQAVGGHWNKHKNAYKAGALATGALGAGAGTATAINAGAGAVGAGKGKRWKGAKTGAKEGWRQAGRQIAHPFNLKTQLTPPLYAAYKAGEKLSKKKKK